MNLQPHILKDSTSRVIDEAPTRADSPLINDIDYSAEDRFDVQTFETEFEKTLPAENELRIAFGIGNRPDEVEDELRLVQSSSESQEGVFWVMSPHGDKVALKFAGTEDSFSLYSDESLINGEEFYADLAGSSEDGYVDYDRSILWRDALMGTKLPAPRLLSEVYNLYEQIMCGQCLIVKPDIRKRVYKLLEMSDEEIESSNTMMGIDSDEFESTTNLVIINSYEFDVISEVTGLEIKDMHDFYEVRKSLFQGTYPVEDLDNELNSLLDIFAPCDLDRRILRMKYNRQRFPDFFEINHVDQGDDSRAKKHAKVWDYRQANAGWVPREPKSEDSIVIEELELEDEVVTGGSWWGTLSGIVSGVKDRMPLIMETIKKTVVEKTADVEVYFDTHADIVGEAIAKGVEEMADYTANHFPQYVEGGIDTIEGMHDYMLRDIDIDVLFYSEEREKFVDIYQAQNYQLEPRIIPPTTKKGEIPLTDAFLTHPLQRAPTLDLNCRNIPLFYPEYWKQVMYNLIDDKNFETLYRFLMRTSDEWSVLSMQFIVDSIVQTGMNNNYDLRSDQHNCGLRTRDVQDITRYSCYTVEVRRYHYVQFVPAFMREVARYCQEGGVFELGNIIQIRTNETSISVSSMLLQQICSTKTFAYNEPFEKAKTNIMLAIKNNCSVNIPYDMMGGMDDPYIGTFKLACAQREYYKWKNCSSGLDFHL